MPLHSAKNPLCHSHSPTDAVVTWLRYGVAARARVLAVFARSPPRFSMNVANTDGRTDGERERDIEADDAPPQNSAHFARAVCGVCGRRRFTRDYVNVNARDAL